MLFRSGRNLRPDLRMRYRNLIIRRHSDPGSVRYPTHQRNRRIGSGVDSQVVCWFMRSRWTPPDGVHPSHLRPSMLTSTPEPHRSVSQRAHISSRDNNGRFRRGDGPCEWQAATHDRSFQWAVSPPQMPPGLSTDSSSGGRP